MGGLLGRRGPRGLRRADRLDAGPGRTPGPDLRSDLVREQLGRIRVDLELVSAYLAQTCDQVACARAAGDSLATPRMQVRLNTLKLAASELMFQAVDRMVQAGLAVGYSRRGPSRSNATSATCGRPG